MKKRTFLSIIIGVMCLMNIFGSFVSDAPLSYFDIFWEALSRDDLSTFWKIIFVSPTSILAILTVLHIYEPRSEDITRNHLALAGIIGFILYLLILGLMYVATHLAIGGGEFLRSLIFGDAYDAQGAEGKAVNFIGLSSFLYPLLFLAYVLIHRFMKYDISEIQTQFSRKKKDEKPSPPNYDENEFL